MNNATEQVVTAEQIYDVLSKQEFQEWHFKGAWDNHITGHDDFTAAEIIQQIKELFDMQ